MKRSAIKRTGFKRSVAERGTGTADSAGKALQTCQGLNTPPRKAIGKIGPRAREWRRVWAFLKPRLEAAGRTNCEFDFMVHDCWGRLDPAHSKKRNKMVGNDIYAVAIACQNIHQILDEQCSHSDMEFNVITAINLHGGLILP